MRAAKVVEAAVENGSVEYQFVQILCQKQWLLSKDNIFFILASSISSTRFKKIPVDNASARVTRQCSQPRKRKPLKRMERGQESQQHTAHVGVENVDPSCDCKVGSPFLPLFLQLVAVCKI